MRRKNLRARHTRARFPAPGHVTLCLVAKTKVDSTIVPTTNETTEAYKGLAMATPSLALKAPRKGKRPPATSAMAIHRMLPIWLIPFFYVRFFTQAGCGAMPEAHGRRNIRARRHSVGGEAAVDRQADADHEAR